MSNKAIFLDRDNTLIEDPGYINSPDQVTLLDGVAEALIELKAMGYKLVVVSNQSAVARGIVTEKVLGEIHDRLRQLLARKNAYLNRIFYCPYHPDGAIAKYRKKSDWRKPEPGMLLAAANDMDIDLAGSWMIGNSSSDVEAGQRAGCNTILINSSPRYRQSEPDQPMADYEGVNLREAVNIIKKHLRSSQTPATQTPTNEIPPLDVIQDTLEPAPEIEPVSQQTSFSEPNNKLGDKTEPLLQNILEQLKSMQRANMFDEFSVMKLMAGLLQVVVLFCLVITIWLLMSPNRQNDMILITLGFAVVLQLMTLTFYMMHGRK